MDNSQSGNNSDRTRMDLLEDLLFGDADIGTFEEFLQGLQTEPDTQSSKAVARDLVEDFVARPQETGPKGPTYSAPWTDQIKQETAVLQNDELQASYHQYNLQNQPVLTDNEKNLELQEPNGKHP